VVFDVAPHADEADPQAAAAAQRRAALCVELEAVVRAMGLQRAWEVKPLVDGKSVMAVLGMKQVCALPCLSHQELSPLTSIIWRSPRPTWKPHAREKRRARQHKGR